MKMYYLVYLPSLKVMAVSQDEAECDRAYREIGRDYDEDYRVMTDVEFIDMVRKTA